MPFALPISLLHGWFVPVLTWLGAVALALALGWRTRRWRIQLLVVAAAAVAGVWVAKTFVLGASVFQPAPPLRVYAWVAAGVFAALAVGTGWRSASRRQRLIGVPAAVLCLLAAAGQVNGYYGYYPTLDALFGRRLAHEVTLRDLKVSGYLGHGGGHLGAAGTATGRARATVLVATPSRKPRAKAPLVVDQAGAGRVLRVTIPGVVSGFYPRRALVYLPPVWFSPQRPRLPVVVLTHGTPGSPEEWFQSAGAAQVADSYAKSHGGWSPILVAVDENGSFTADSECVDRPHMRVDTYLAYDVPAFMERNFGAATDASKWAIEGLSEGGTCALTVALRHPDKYRSFVDLAGEARPSLGGNDLKALYGGSVAAERSYDPSVLLRSHSYGALGAWFEVGAQDGKYVAINRALYQLAVRAGADAHLVLPPGGHTFWAFRAGLRDSFPWLCERLGSA